MRLPTSLPSGGKPSTLNLKPHPFDTKPEAWSWLARRAKQRPEGRGTEAIGGVRLKDASQTPQPTTNTDRRICVWVVHASLPACSPTFVKCRKSLLTYNIVQTSHRERQGQGALRRGSPGVLCGLGLCFQPTWVPAEAILREETVMSMDLWDLPNTDRGCGFPAYSPVKHSNSRLLEWEIHLQKVRFDPWIHDHFCKS